MSFDAISYSKAKSVQAQLDQAIADGDQLAEVQQARVDKGGNTYTTLKERIDAEQATNNNQDARLSSLESQISLKDATVDAHESRLDAHDTAISQVQTKANNLESDLNSQNDRIDNIVAQAGTDNTEIVDARQGVDGTTHTVLKNRLDKMETQLVESEQQTAILTHGQNIIYSSNPSPVKVELYGNTDINLFGKQNVSTTLNDVYSGANIFLKPDGSVAVNTSDRKLKTVEVGKYYLFIINWDEGTENNASHLRMYKESVPTETLKTIGVTNDGNLTYVKFTVDTTESVSFSIRNDVDGSNYVFKNAILRDISETTYNEIDVSLTDADVERMFPYVDSIQHVKNPVVKVEGANLLPPFSEWTLHANATVKSPYELELNATGWNQQNEYELNASPSQKYTVSFNGNSVFDVLYNGVEIHTAKTSPFTFETNSNTNKITLQFKNLNQTGKYTVQNPMLNIGTTAIPFVPKNDSYLYAETTLAGNANKKDILRKNEEKNRWEVERNFKINEVLDGNLNWQYRDYTNGEYATCRLYGDIVYAKKSNEVNFYLKDYNGDLITPLPQMNYDQIENIPDERVVTMYSGNTSEFIIYVNVLKTELPSLDTMGVRQYFADKNYFLSYQLAEPVTEVEGKDFPLVEGDLSISGDAQVEVGSGFDVIENEDGSKTFELWTDRSQTANLTEVKAYYQDTIKSSFARNNERLSDTITDVSILKRQMLDTIIRLDALEGSGA